MAGPELRTPFPVKSTITNCGGACRRGSAKPDTRLSKKKRMIWIEDLMMAVAQGIASWKSIGMYKADSDPI